LIKDESVELIGSNVALWASQLLPSGFEWIVIAAVVIVVKGAIAAAHLMTRHTYTTVAALNESAQQPVIQSRAARAPL
jgi:hypothetical protein